MLKQTKKAFTLVELIIVITILAILATIGFVSFQGYTSDSRNSKRLNDISGLQSKLEVTVAKSATDILTFGSGITANELINFKAGSGTILTGSIAAPTTNNYVAWNVKYSTFGVDSNEFSDPGTGTPAYKFGAAKTNLGNIYQFAAKLESTNTDAQKSFVKWVFLTTASVDTASGLIKGTVSNTGLINGSTTDFPY